MKDLNDIYDDYRREGNRPLYSNHLQKKLDRGTKLIGVVWLIMLVVGVLLFTRVIGCEYPCII